MNQSIDMRFFKHSKSRIIPASNEQQDVKLINKVELFLLGKLETKENTLRKPKHDFKSKGKIILFLILFQAFIRYARHVG